MITRTRTHANMNAALYVSAQSYQFVGSNDLMNEEL